MSSRKRAVVRMQRQRRNRNVLYIAIVSVVVVAMAVAIATSRGSDSKASTPQTQPVTITGAALPAYDSAASADPGIGQTIPTVTGTSFAGDAVTITDDGKPKVLLFAAHWCPHCQKEIPLLAPDLRANPLPANVEMITVSTGVNASAPNYPPSSWFDRVQWPTPVLADDANSTVAGAYGLTSYPYFVFVDAHNKVVARTSGEITLEQFRSAVNKLA